MDPSYQEFEFLDLTDVDEEERNHLHEVLYGNNPAVDIPWDLYECDSEEYAEQFDGEIAVETSEAIATNPLPTSPTQVQHVHEHTPHQPTSPSGHAQYHATLAQPQTPVTVVSVPPPPPPVTAPPPAMTTVYQVVGPPLPSVFVSNLTTNVSLHGYNAPSYARHMSPQQAYPQVPDVSGTTRDTGVSSLGRRQKPGKLGPSNRRQEAQQFRGHDTQAEPSSGAPYHLIPVVHPFPYYQTPEHAPTQHAAAAAPFFVPMYHTPVYGHPQFHQQPAAGAPVMYGSDVPQPTVAGAAETLNFAPEAVPEERAANGYCVEAPAIPVVESIASGPIVAELSRPEATEYLPVAEVVSQEGLQVSYESGYPTNPVESSSIMEEQSAAFSIVEEPVASAYVQAEEEIPAPVNVTGSDIVFNEESAESNSSDCNKVHVEDETSVQHADEVLNNSTPVEVVAQASTPNHAVSPQDTVVHKISGVPDATSPFPRRSGPSGVSALINSDEINQSTSPLGSGRTWASLFVNDGQSRRNSPPATAVSNAIIAGSSKPLATVKPFQNAVPVTPHDLSGCGQKPQEVLTPAVDRKNFPQLTKPIPEGPHLYRLGEFLSQYQLDHRAISLQPRGLTNRSNWCYINSTLQALLGCPPFYNLMKALPLPPTSSRAGAASPIPIIDSMVQFVNEFQPMPITSRVGRREKAQRKEDGSIEVQSGIAFEPSYIYKMLNSIQSNAFKVEGRQEDAEEFLSCLLNALNDEMQELMKLVRESSQTTLTNGDIANGDAASQSQDEDENLWKEMGPKNRGSVTRRADFGHTPLSDIFRGQLRSRVQRAGDEFTDNVQPFFTLQLDIEKAQSVKDALELLVGRDQLEGVTCSKTNQQIEAWQQVTLEKLPYVLVLHLKWFDYKLDGCSKIVKTVEFPIDLKVDGKLMSSQKKWNPKQKQYKLFAVVYHDGKEATKGHYVTDVFHVGYGSWLRYDDSSVKTIQEAQLLHPRSPRVPYLLYYRRCDTIGTVATSCTISPGDRAR